MRKSLAWKITVIAQKEIRYSRLDEIHKAEFRQYKANKLLYWRRFAIAIATLFWMIFLYWDIKYHRNFDNIIPIICVRVLCGLFLCIIAALSFLESFKDAYKAEARMMAAVVAAWISILIMMLLSPAPNNYLDYYSGLPLVLFFLFAVLCISPGPAITCAIFLAVTFLLTQGSIGKHIPDSIFRDGVTYRDDFEYYSNLAYFYLGSFIFLGSLICWQMDLAFKKEFIHRKKLLAERNRIKVLNTELETKIAHVQRMHEQLAAEAENRRAQADVLLKLKEQQRQSAIDANLKKSFFLAAATHDLRQPLTALEAIITVLGQSIAQGNLDAAKDHIVVAATSSRTMRRTLNAVLEISRLESGIVVPDYTTFDVCPLLRDVHNQFAASAAAHGLDFRVRLPSGRWFAQVRSDRDLLRRILSNLVSNAIKYTAVRHDGQRGVLLGATCYPSRLRVDVYDTGIGITKQYWSKIFDPFFQVNNRERDREKGLGLGLSIVSQIISLLEQHRLSFSSIPGRGSRFSIDIPTIGNSLSEPLAAAPEITPADADSIKGAYILFVEDDALVRKTVKTMLESWGSLVEACVDVDEVKEFVLGAERIPDLVLTDFRLPDGACAHDVIRIVSTEFKRKIPVIVLSGEVLSLDEIKQQSEIIISKPADPQQLRQAIAKYIAPTGREPTS